MLVSPTSSVGSLVARNISKSFAGQVVLQDVSATVGPRARIGLVGPNGVGKSTLLRILAGLEDPDGGRVERAPSGLTVGYLPQEPDADPAETLRAYLARRTGVAGAERAMEELARTMGGALDTIQAYTDSVERFVALGGEDFGARAEQVATSLGLPLETLDRPIGTLSGGQAARAALAAILLARFSVFLLDEPTNNLDFEGLARLERFVDGLDAGLVVVSHDRAFLERTIEQVLELDEGSRRAIEYSGGFEAYQRERDQRRAGEYEAHERYLAERRRLTEEVRRQTTWSESGAIRSRRRTSDPDKHIKAREVQRAENTATKASAAKRQLERLEPVDKPWEAWRLELRFEPAGRSGDVVFRLEGAVVVKGAFRLGPVSLEIRWGDRVAIVGANGAGKTTLVDALLGDVALASGRRRSGSGVIVGAMDQPRVTFADERPFLEVFMRRSGVLAEEARSLLAKFGLTASHVERPPGSLSPGERSRALLALLAVQRANCLVLDEPTNHLDLPAIEQLERALTEFTGTVLLVTHDRKLLDRFAPDYTIEITDGRIQTRLT